MQYLQGYLRAATILSWCLVFDVFREWLFANHLSAINAKMANWKKPAHISRLDDFSDYTERTTIDLARDAHIVSKEEYKLLTSLLDRRNSYAHATGRSISPSATEAFLEEAINEVILKYT